MSKAKQSEFHNNTPNSFPYNCWHIWPWNLVRHHKGRTCNVYRGYRSIQKGKSDTVAPPGELQLQNQSQQRTCAISQCFRDHEEAGIKSFVIIIICLIINSERLSTTVHIMLLGDINNNNFNPPQSETTVALIEKIQLPCLCPMVLQQLKGSSPMRKGRCPSFFLKWCPGTLLISFQKCIVSFCTVFEEP